MVRAFIVILTINFALIYLSGRSYKEAKLTQDWVAYVALQASLQRAQDAWLRELDTWLTLSVVPPEQCQQGPCLLQTQSVQKYVHEPLAFWRQTALAVSFKDSMYPHQTYAIVEVLPCEESKNTLRGTFVAVNELGMQLRSQLVAQQNGGQLSLRFVLE